MNKGDGGGVVLAGVITAIVIVQARGPGYTESGTWGALGK